MPNDRLKDRLNRLKGQIAPENKSDTGPQHSDRYSLMAEAVGGELITNFAGAYCLKTTFYSPEYIHGETPVAELAPVSHLPLSAFTVKDNPSEVEISRLLFVDTETTGLGGTGAVAFLVGLGRVIDGGFEVRQYLIPDYSDETAMLEDLLAQITSEVTAVTYNGAAFDLPLLRDRMIINRVARKLDLGGHIDLLHAARRLFRRRLVDCTLTNVERNLLDFHRRDDIPGYMIPSVYFDWLGEQNLDRMIPVLEHNRLDIVSLYFLAVKIAEAFSSDGATLRDTADLHSLARVYGRRRDNDRVIDLYRRIEDENVEPLPEDALLFHAGVFKKKGDLDEAVKIWQCLAQGHTRESYWANLELAKYYEHRVRDFGRALSHTETADRISPYGVSHRPHLDRRLRRLRHKLASH